MSNFRVVQEVDEVVGKKSFISNDDISRFSYISALIKESLRVYPPLFLITRETNADVEVDGLKIPADSMFAVSYFRMSQVNAYSEIETFCRKFYSKLCVSPMLR